MDNQQKQNLSLLLLCVLCSIAASLIIVVFPFYYHAPKGISQISTQTVTINEQAMYKVNINTATEREILTLPGVGAATARKIIENRPYNDIWELADIEGIGGKTLKNIIEKIEARQ